MEHEKHEKKESKVQEKKEQVAKKMKKESRHDFGLPAGEKVTPQLKRRFKNYFKKHAGTYDKYDKGHALRQNNFYEFNKPEYD